MADINNLININYNYNEISLTLLIMLVTQRQEPSAGENVEKRKQAHFWHIYKLV